jgi:hypothetical protein
MKRFVKGLLLAVGVLVGSSAWAQYGCPDGQSVIYTPNAVPAYTCPDGSPYGNYPASSGGGGNGGSAAPSKADLEVMRIERDAEKTARAAQPLIDQINRSYEEAMSYDARAAAAELVNQARWGAFALSKTARPRKAGFINAPTEKQAMAGALQECNDKDCKIVKTYTNVCYAAVWGQRKDGGDYDYLAQAGNPKNAKSIALKVCNKIAQQCTVYKEDCTGNALWGIWNANLNK